MRDRLVILTASLNAWQIELENEVVAMDEGLGHFTHPRRTRAFVKVLACELEKVRMLAEEAIND